MVALDFTVDVQLSPGVWTDIGADVLAIGGMPMSRGISGNGPLDRVASTGQVTFALQNDDTNSGGIEGWYSLAHANRRAGWAPEIAIRIRFTAASIVNKVVFRGKVRTILPDAGAYGPRRVLVTAYDPIRDLAEADATETPLQEDAAEDELIDAVLDTIAAENQPPARDLDAGVDTSPFAFDDLGGTVPKALALIRDVVVSSLGYFYAAADGTACYRSRHTVAVDSSAFTLDNDMVDLVVPASLDGVFNHFRVTIHPKVKSPAATDELYTLPTGTTIELGPFGSREITVEYSDPNDRQTKVGGASVVTALVAGTHYAANSAADGSGTNLSSALSATLAVAGSSATYTLANTSSDTIFVTLLKVIGKAVRDPGPQTLQSVAAGVTNRPTDLDLPYQSDPEVAQSAADYLRSIYEDVEQQVSSVTFCASESEAFMTQALNRDITDLITISEQVTGIAAVFARIQRVMLTLTEHGHLWCTWELAPADNTRFWQWGIVGASEWGETTVYGF